MEECEFILLTFCLIDPLYERQAIESDAYAYGETTANDFFNCAKLKDEALGSYKDYRDKRNLHNQEYTCKIENSLGKDYNEKLDVMIKINYLGLEYNKLLDQIGNNRLQDKQRYRVIFLLRLYLSCIEVKKREWLAILSTDVTLEEEIIRLYGIRWDIETPEKVRIGLPKTPYYFNKDAIMYCIFIK